MSNNYNDDYIEGSVFDLNDEWNIEREIIM